MASSGTPSRSSPARWIILIARGQDDLYEHLACAFERDPQVDVILDRREDLHRNPATVIANLRTRGVVVIRRSPREEGDDNEYSSHR